MFDDIVVQSLPPSLSVSRSGTCSSVLFADISLIHIKFTEERRLSSAKNTSSKRDVFGLQFHTEETPLTVLPIQRLFRMN